MCYYESMADTKSPSTEGLKEFGRNMIIGVVTTLVIGLIAIFSLSQEEFLLAFKNPLVWYGFGQTAGLFLLKDVLTALTKGVDKGMHIEGKNTDNENLEKGLTRF